MDLVAGAVGSIIGKLGALLQEEYKLQKGLPKQIESLKNELECAQTALLKVRQTPPEQLDPQVRLWARKVTQGQRSVLRHGGHPRHLPRRCRGGARPC